MKSEIAARLENLPYEFLPIKVFVDQYLNRELHIDTLGTIKIVKNPEFTEAYFINIFEGASQIYFDNYSKKYDQEIPEAFSLFLRQMNGFNFCDFNIYGLTPSIYKSSEGILDRSDLQPLDIGTANELWKFDYDRTDFHFGSRYFDDEQTCSYFFDGDSFRSCLATGEVVGTWTSFSDFLSSELKTTEQNETNLS